jgi:prolipoprotein diacylglyceryltransferase
LYESGFVLRVFCGCDLGRLGCFANELYGNRVFLLACP